MEIRITLITPGTGIGHSGCRSFSTSMIFSRSTAPFFLYQWMMFDESAAPTKPWLESGL